MADDTLHSPLPNGAVPSARVRVLLWKVYLYDFDKVMWILMAGGAVAIVALGALAGGKGLSGTPAALLGGLLALILALAAGAIGAFTGFLFGLPRTLTSNELRGTRADWDDLANGPGARTAGGDKAEDSDSNQALPTAESEAATATTAAVAQSGTIRSSYTDVNTNLEQISDWLTKIIVGVGLTQLNSIPGEIDAFGGRVEDYFIAGGKALGIGIGIYCLILGFFLAYVGTRVRLSLVFTASQRNNNQTGGGRDVDAIDALYAESAGTSPGEGNSDPTLRKADAEVLRKSLTELTTLDQLRARANALARSARPTEARDLYEHILKQAPATPDLLADYAQVLSLTGQNEKAQEVLGTVNVLSSSSEEKREAARKVGESTLRGQVLAGLYGRDGRDYEYAIARLDELAELPGKDRDLWVHIWSACAHGQRHAVKGQDADRDKVREEVRKALEIEPKRKGYLASLYDPNLVRNGEDDLVSLYPDTELSPLLLSPDTPAP